MNPSQRKLERAAGKRRFLVHLSVVQNPGDSLHKYALCIKPWAAHRKRCTKQHQRLFSDECALIEVVNPLLPEGSDVRDVLAHIEGQGGFFYLLELAAEEARRLGWRE
jgi:hypothetical protein